jgi:hypothetical protein
MNITTVRDNLKSNIALKEQEYKSENYDNYRSGGYKDEVELAVWKAGGEFLRSNITELKALLRNIELCCQKAADETWISNPDRQGGSFTEYELDSNRGWR